MKKGKQDKQGLFSIALFFIIITMSFGLLSACSHNSEGKPDNGLERDDACFSEDNYIIVPDKKISNAIELFNSGDRHFFLYEFSLRKPCKKVIAGVEIYQNGLLIDEKDLFGICHDDGFGKGQIGGWIDNDKVFLSVASDTYMTSGECVLSIADDHDSSWIGIVGRTKIEIGEKTNVFMLASAKNIETQQTLDSIFVSREFLKSPNDATYYLIWVLFNQ